MNLKYLIFLISIITISCNQNSQTNSILKEWKNTNILSIKNLDLENSNEEFLSFRGIVGNAEVVCLGESRHDISEQFKLKNRLVKYLIEEMEFRAFALEASLPYSIQLNNYITTGIGNIDQLMSEMPGWFLWDTQELKELLIWIREFNSQTDNKVSFFGFDIVAPNNAYKQILDYLKSVDEIQYTEMENIDFGRDIINDNHWPTTLDQFGDLSEERKSTIKKNINQLYQVINEGNNKYPDKSSEMEYNRILKLAYSVKEAINMFSANDRIEMGLIRDRAMANICSWIIKQNTKTIIWAHNVHIAKSEFTMSMFPNQNIKGMGAILADEFQNNLISIGGAFGKGKFESDNRVFPMPPETTIDGTLSQLNLDNLIVDLRQSTDKPRLKKWLRSENTLKGQEFEMSCVPIAAFDALYYTNDISKVRYNTLTMERMGN